MTVKSHDLAHIRSVVLAGHAGAGKTTLAEQVLFRAGAIPRLGRVDDGTAHLDHEPEEQKHHQSLSLAVGTFEHGEHEITVVDTPGYPDFVAEMIEGFHAADAALFVMDASGGVEAGLEAAVGDWAGRRRRRPASSSTSATARTRTRGAALDALREAFGNKIAPLHLAIGAADTFSGYVDLVHRKAWRFEGGKEVEIPVPDELADEVARRRDQLLEAAAEADDDVFEKYLGEEEISRRGARRVPAQGRPRVDPRAGARRLGRQGHRPHRAARRDRALPALARGGGPVRRDRQGRQGRRGPRDGGQLLVRVFKTAADPFVGRLTYLRVLSGTLKSQGTVFNADKGEDERIGQLLYLHGKEQEPAAELRAGEIGAVAKLGVTETGDTLTTRDAALHLPPIDFPEPTLQVAIDPVSKADLDKMGPALQRMLEEEPTARVERSDTGEQILRAVGEAHVAVITERLKRKFGAAIATRTPRSPTARPSAARPRSTAGTRSRPAATACSATSGSSSSPTPAAGVEFAEKVVGGSVPRTSSRASRRASARRPPRASSRAIPLIDFKATLYDGSFHPVDSNELSFKIAASMALKDGVLQAKPALLEPIMAVEVRVPEAYMGEVNRDLNGRRGRVLGMDTAERACRSISAHVPQAELFSYATELRSLTGGRGHVLARSSTTTRTCRRTSPTRSSRRTRRTTARVTEPAGAAD